MNWLKQNWIKVGLGVLILGAIIFVKEWNGNSFNTITVSETASPITTQTIPHTNDELCKEVPFTAPTKDEIDLEKKVSQNKFVRYLRKSIDAFLNQSYISCEEDCLANELLGPHYQDSAYDFKLGPAFQDTDYIKGRFILLEASGSIGGGMGLFILFKERPDKIFEAWVYGHDDSDKYDLRMFKEHELKEGQSMSEIQKAVINQICNQETGI